MRKLAWAVSTLLLAAGHAAADDKVTLITAARIHTMDVAQPAASAMAYDKGGRILAVGDIEALAKRFPQARRKDLGQATLIPGLIDAHAHVGGLGLAMLGVALAILGWATLWMAVAADMGASLIVIANGLRALRVRG